MEAGFACSKAPMTPAVLRWEIKGILCFYECAHMYVCVCVCVCVCVWRGGRAWHVHVTHLIRTRTAPLQ